MAKQTGTELIERYIEKTRTSESPAWDYQFTNGLIEMAYVIGDMSTKEYDRHLANVQAAEKAGTLRKRARDLRLTAQHADRLDDFRTEMDRAAELERQADEIDGTAARRAEQESARSLFVAPLMAPRASEAERRQQLVANGLQQMEQALGAARHG